MNLLITYFVTGNGHNGKCKGAESYEIEHYEVNEEISSDEAIDKYNLTVADLQSDNFDDNDFLMRPRIFDHRNGECAISAQCEAGCYRDYRTLTVKITEHSLTNRRKYIREKYEKLEQEYSKINNEAIAELCSEQNLNKQRYDLVKREADEVFEREKVIYNITIAKAKENLAKDNTAASDKYYDKIRPLKKDYEDIRDLYMKS
jgi:hypothetical protein